MAFYFLRKKYKAFYAPKNKPESVNVPRASYTAVRKMVTQLRRRKFEICRENICKIQGNTYRC